MGAPMGLNAAVLTLVAICSAVALNRKLFGWLGTSQQLESQGPAMLPGSGAVIKLLAKILLDLFLIYVFVMGVL